MEVKSRVWGQARHMEVPGGPQLVTTPLLSHIQPVVLTASTISGPQAATRHCHRAASSDLSTNCLSMAPFC